MQTHPPAHTCVSQEEVFVTTNGVHLDIVIPLDVLPSRIRQKLQPQADTRFIAFGWGDKGFFINTPTWDDLTFSTAVNAMFLKSPSVMHVTYYPNAYRNWKRVELCPAQLTSLTQFIHSTFQQTDNQQFILVDAAGYTHRDSFYEAVGSYNCIYTCNVWVNQALKRAHVPTAIWSPLDWGVIRHLEESSKVQSSNVQGSSVR